ncbi:hypothetical protein [Acinetobacter portensis]|uniref:hypothetical protein n=1 Tax=Acinetobacter portensis TaxID=1839785 RepID=UPI001E42631A|nr:hypothetical protein [Acinetobacter portensis]
MSVTADVSDKAGNPATQASNPISVDIAAPTIAITGPLAGDDVINATEKGQPLTISGTTTGVGKRPAGDGDRGRQDLHRDGDGQRLERDGTGGSCGRTAYNRFCVCDC